YYKAVFLNKNVAPETKKLLLLDRKLSPEQILQSDRKFHSRQMVYQNFEDNGVFPDSAAMKEANGKVMQLTKESPFSPYFEVTYREMAVKEFGIIKIKARIFTTIPVDQNPILITATFMHKGYAYYYRGYRLTTEQITPFQWNEVEVFYLTPEVRRPEDPFRVTIWLKGDYPVYVDDVTAEISEPIN
ncbi:MAG: hypothetical protein Q8T08_24000, partial [Ignavibacteria bacterium]|nr:hypothetical protein [Ignavibacteria bacterium]